MGASSEILRWLLNRSAVTILEDYSGSVQNQQFALVPVVAEEIRKLADNTKRNLSDMRGFTQNIQQAAGAGQQSLKNTLNSTSGMNEKLDNIAETVKENVAMLNTTVSDVHEVTSLMENVREAAQQVNQAMSVSAQDAERLHTMTQAIHDDAAQSAENAKQISKMDGELSDIVHKMIAALNGGLHAITNEELITNLRKAKTAHENWMLNLKRIADEMVLYPIQTDSHRCAFGHFYHAITIDQPEVHAEWAGIDEVHAQLHTMGATLLAAVKANEGERAHRLYDEAEMLSKKIFVRIDNTIHIIEQKMQQGEEVLRFG